jgi:hypothetical protein
VLEDCVREAGAVELARKLGPLLLGIADTNPIGVVGGQRVIGFVRDVLGGGVRRVVGLQDVVVDVADEDGEEK